MFRWGLMLCLLVVLAVGSGSFLGQYTPRYLGPLDMQLQEDAVSCGPAALSYILDTKGIPVTQESMRLLAGTGPSGTSMLGLAQAAESNGLHAYGLRGGYDLLLDIPLPAIAVFKDHYVVLTRVSPEEVEVGDPLFGFYVYPKRAFLRNWQGQILVLEV